MKMKQILNYRWVKYLWFLIKMLLFETATMWMRGYSMMLDVPVCFAKYVLLFLIWKKLRREDTPTTIFKYLILGYSFWVIFPLLVSGGSVLFGLINHISSYLGIITAYLFLSKAQNKKWALLITGIFVVLAVWYNISGHYYYYNYLSHRNFTGITQKRLKQSWTVINKTGLELSNHHFEDKLVLLDFWSTSCGVCFQKFPKVELIYNKYKSNPKFVLFSVNIPIERDTAGMAFSLIERSGKYTFPTVVGSDSMKAAFGVTAYPTVVLLRNDTILFEGSIELVEAAIEKELK